MSGHVAVRSRTDDVSVLLEKPPQQLATYTVVVGDEDRGGHVARGILTVERRRVNVPRCLETRIAPSRLPVPRRGSQQRGTP